MQNFRRLLAAAAAVQSPTKMLIPALAMLTSSRQNPHATPLPDVSNHFAEVDATQKVLIVDRSGQYTTEFVLAGEVAAEFAMLVAASYLSFADLGPFPCPILMLDCRR